MMMINAKSNSIVVNERMYKVVTTYSDLVNIILLEDCTAETLLVTLNMMATAI